jgi:hypothetical protein
MNYLEARYEMRRHWVKRAENIAAQMPIRMSDWKMILKVSRKELWALEGDYAYALERDRWADILKPTDADTARLVKNRARSSAWLGAKQTAERDMEMLVGTEIHRRGLRECRRG